MIRRVLSTERIIPHFLANLFGLQLIRYSLAHLLYNFKFYLKKKKNSHVNLVKKNGFCQINQFLSANEFDQLKKEFNELINSDLATNLQNNEGTQYFTVFLNDEKMLQKFPILKKLGDDSKIKELFQGSENKKIVDIRYRLERIIVKDENIEDTNKNYHYTFKAWLYLTDSDDNNGPLVILPGSHKFSLKRVFNSYIESIKYSLYVKKKDKLKKENILNNYAKDNYQYFRYKNIKNNLDRDSKKLISKSNSFILANTHCIHRRGDAKKNKIRDAIHFYSRENPFN